MSKLFSVYVVIIFLFGKFAMASPLVVGAYDFEPYFSVNTNKIGGLWFDDINALLEHAGVEFEWVTYPPARMLQSLERGAVNLTVMARREQMESTLYFGRKVFTRS